MPAFAVHNKSGLLVKRAQIVCHQRRLAPQINCPFSPRTCAPDVRNRPFSRWVYRQSGAQVRGLNERFREAITAGGIQEDPAISYGRDVGALALIPRLESI